MTAKAPSRTAALTAVARALHRNEPPPLVLDDPFAFDLAGEEAPAIAARLEADLSAEGRLVFTRWVCVRARWAEDAVEEGLRDGVRQYVILGAGLDSFVYRRRDLADRLRVFEVDHPASQAWKRERLAALGVEPPVNLVYVASDFETETLRQSLERAGFDFDAPAVFSWIGVTMYLTADGIRNTLATVRSCREGTRIVLTYNQPRSALRGAALSLETALVKIVNEMGEPFVSLFTPDEIEPLLRAAGFTDIVHFGPDEAIRTYFPGRSDVRFGGTQLLVMARVPQS